MSDPSALAVAWRVGVTVFVIVTPTLLFFQLLRFLVWLRDDDLITQVVERHDLETGETDGALATVAADSPGASSAHGSDPERAEDSLLRCDACGRPNAREAVYCSGCLCRLE
jgi:hypothetical protein